MKPKTLKMEDGTEVIAMKDGKPLYIDDDGKEVAFDVQHTTSTISRLNAEAKQHRTAKEDAEGKLKEFEGIEDPAAAKKAMDTLKSIDQAKLVDAGKVDEVKAEAIKATEAKFQPIVEENATLKATLNSEMIGGRFARSTFIQEKIAVPSDIIEARFGKNFTIKDGKVVATDNSGNQIYSKERPGEPADFDEALELLVEQYPQKDHILKGDQQRGSNSNGTRTPSGNASGGKTMTRVEFDKWAQTEPGAAQKAIVEGTTTVVD